MVIQFINYKTGKEFNFEFDENVSLGRAICFVSDYFHNDNIRYYYCSTEVFRNNSDILVRNIDKEIYFIC